MEEVQLLNFCIYSYKCLALLCSVWHTFLGKIQNIQYYMVFQAIFGYNLFYWKYFILAMNVRSNEKVYIINYPKIIYKLKKT